MQSTTCVRILVNQLTNRQNPISVVAYWVFVFIRIMELYDYQREIICQIDVKLKLFNRLVCQLSTGGGKTVIFAEIAKQHKGQTLILVDSVELIHQTKRNFTNAGTFEAKNKFLPSDNIVIAMSDTIWSRIKKDPYLINRFDLLIVDECHVWKFNKIFDFAPNAKILGFTATPVRLKRINYFDEHGVEWTKEETMSMVYDDIVCGIDIAQLIERGFLVDEETYTIPVNNQKLKTDNTGEFTNESINDALNNEEYRLDVLANYETICKDKKTMIFAPNTEINLALYNLFIDKGYTNCKFYDSVNKQDLKRSDVVTWFKNTPNAILFNVGVFTKGFDVKDVEAIILARPTASLSLFIQIAGRGSRTTDADQIYKDRFIFIDGGGNVERFGLWSTPRDWEKIFFHGLKKPKAKKELLDQVKECKKCGFIMPKSENICEECGHDNFFELEIEEKELITSDKIIATQVKVIYPDAKKIIKYSINRKEDVFFALKVLNNQIFDLFIKNNIDAEQFTRNLHGGVNRVIDKNLKQNHFLIINSQLRSEAHRTYNQQKNMLLTKLTKHYGIQ